MDRCGSKPMISVFLGWTYKFAIYPYMWWHVMVVGYFLLVIWGHQMRSHFRLRVLPGAEQESTMCSFKQCQAKRRSLQRLRCVHRKPSLGQSYMDDAAKSSWRCLFWQVLKDLECLDDEGLISLKGPMLTSTCCTVQLSPLEFQLENRWTHVK